MLLLEYGVDPNLEFNGYKFFEREDFCKGSKRIDFEWLAFLAVELRFDIFKLAEKTGKSLVDYLDGFGNVSVSVSGIKFDFPVSKLSKKVFKSVGYCMFNVLAPIDDEGRSIIHYDLVNATKKIFRAWDRKRAEELKHLRDRTGKTYYHFMVENDKDAILGSLMTTIEDFKYYAEMYASIHGVDVLKFAGGRFLVKALTKPFRPKLKLAKYFLQNGVSLQRVYGDELLGNAVCQNIKWKSHPCNKIGAVLVFLLRHGFMIEFRYLRKFLKLNRVNLANAVAEQCDANYLEVLFESMREEYEHCEEHETLPFNAAFRAFFSHPKVRLACPQNSPNTFTLLDQHFFILCKAKAKVAKFFLQLGVDTRKLIGAGNYAVGVIYRYSYGRVFPLLRNAGWTGNDFKSLSWLSNHSLHRHFITNEHEAYLCFFGEMPASELFSSVNFDTVVGDGEICAICHDRFEAEDQVFRLQCKHVFHVRCSKKYVEGQRCCPYCRSPLDSSI